MGTLIEKYQHAAFSWNDSIQHLPCVVKRRAEELVKVLHARLKLSVLKLAKVAEQSLLINL